MQSNHCFSLDISPNKHHPDLTIFANDSKSGVTAHRAVLASHSYMLKTAFISADVDGEAVLVLPDFSLEDVNDMIQLLYGQIPELKTPSEIFSVLGLNPSCQETEYFVDQDESELIFENMKSDLVEDPFKKRPRSRPKVFTDPSTNLVPDDPGAVDIDVEAYIVNEPSDPKPWVCHLCLLSGAHKPLAKNPYRSVHKHNLKYHILKKHFNMEIPKNWKCDLCAKTFISRSGLRQHKRDTCPMSLQAAPRTLQESRTPTPCEEPESDAESVAGSNTQMFECGTCHNLFESIKEIQKHMLSCVGVVEEEVQEQQLEQEQVMYQCNECWEAGQEFIFPSMIELSNHIESEHNDDGNLEPKETAQIESLAPYIESEALAKEVDLINAEVLIEESIGMDDIAQPKVEENIVDESVLVEGVIENESHVLFDDYECQSVENPEIDTNEVLVQCEAPIISDDNSNEITLVMVDENDNPVFCSVCSNGFSSPELLTEHLTHHPACPTCGELVLSQTALSHHLATHPLCGVCGDRFADLEVLEKHEQNHADIEQAIRGDSDTISLKYQNPEIRDAISSIQSAPVIVNDDFIDGRKSAELIQEANPGFTIGNLDVSQDLDLSSLLAQQNIRAQCDLCEKTFSNETVLDMHIQGAHGGYIHPVQNQESPKFQLEILENMINCNFCQESFSSMPELNAHTAALHREILEATQALSEAQQTNSQEQVAVRENIPPFNCTLCKDTFAKVGQLSKHINSSHKVNKMESGKPFRCQLCTCNFLQLTTLEKHARIQHHGLEYSYSCPDCGKTFKHLASLQSHLRIHSSVKLFQCGSCSRTFNWEASLRTHMKKCDGSSPLEYLPIKKKKIVQKAEVNIEVGLGEESLTVKCSRCGEKFSDQGQFSGHTCPGSKGRGKRYRCGKCHLLFKSRKIIRRHLRSCQVGQELGEYGGVEVHAQRTSKRQRKAVKDDLYVSDIEGSDKELQDLVDSDAEEEFKINAKDYSESSDNSGSSGDEQDDFTIEPSIKKYTVESEAKIPVVVDANDNPHPLKPKKTYICEYCERVFKHGHHLKEHVMGHTGEYPYNCEKCNKGFRRSLGLEKHNCSDPSRPRKRRISVIQKTPIEDRPSSTSPLLSGKADSHVCKTCNMAFDKQQKYAAHFRTSVMCRKFPGHISQFEMKTEAVAQDPSSPTIPRLYNCSVCQFSTDDGQVINQHLQTEDHIRRGMVEEFTSSMAKYKCELCLFTAETEYKFKRHLVTKKHLENEEIRTEEELLDKLNNPKIYSCLVCEKSFKDMVDLDEHVEEHKKDEELTSRSGRKIKPKRFHDDLNEGGQKRKASGEVRGGKTKRMRRAGLDSSQDSLAESGVECGICGEDFSSHTAHFVHMLLHVPPEIVKSLPVVDGGGVGWCPHCPGPVRLEVVDQHMAEMHNNMEDEESEHGLKIGEKKLEFDEIDPEELEALELPDSDSACLGECRPCRVDIERLKLS